jgi:CHRD domain
MSKRAGRIARALSLLVLLALGAAGLATAGSTPPPAGPAKPGKIVRAGQNSFGNSTGSAAAVPVIAYRLAARLTPSTGSSNATGRWDGVLVHTFGVVRTGALPSLLGCSVTGPPRSSPRPPGSPPPRASGLPYKIKCNWGTVPPFTIPGSGQHWILAWRLSYSNLSSAVNGVDIRLNSPGAAGVLAANLCGPCTSGKFGHTTVTDDLANALLKGSGYVVVHTANSPGGEISGQIVRVRPTGQSH